jgi:hypothetical protein
MRTQFGTTEEVYKYIQKPSATRREDFILGEGELGTIEALMAG